MKIAIMQPYFFPYLGYFNLLHASDRFILLDDVQFIRRGWINRNRIQMGDEPLTFTVPLVKAPRETPINRMRLSPEHFPVFVDKFRKQLKAAYGAAPFFDDISTLVDRTLETAQDLHGDGMAALAERSIRAVLEHVGMTRGIERASTLPQAASGRDLKAGSRLIHIARALGATHYVNPPGGRDLYSAGTFAEAGLELGFVKPALPPYDRPAPFIAGLSILDALMYCPPEDVSKMIAQYSVEQ